MTGGVLMLLPELNCGGGGGGGKSICFEAGGI